jgi:hypothetical protein
MSESKLLQLLKAAANPAKPALEKLPTYSRSGANLSEIAEKFRALPPYTKQKFLNASPEQQAQIFRDAAALNISKGKKTAAGVAIGAAAMGAGDNEANASSLSKKAAMAILDKVNTAEKAVKLTGETRSEYLKALDVIHGPVEQRAKNLGFDTTVYHGTPYQEQLNRFKAGNTNSGQLYGAGFYTSKDPEIANIYTDILDQHTGRTLDDASGQVLKLKARTGNIFGKDDLAKNDLPIELKNKLANLVDKKELPANWNKINNQSRALEALRGKVDPVELSKTIHSHGFESIAGEKNYKPIAEGGSEVRDINLLKSNQLRSDNAAFDPRFKDSSLLLAGAGPAALPSTDFGDILKQGYQSFVAGRDKVADAITQQTDPAQTLKQSGVVPQDELQQAMGRMAFDPINLAPGAAQAVDAAASLAVPQGDNMPQQQQKPANIPPQFADGGWMDATAGAGSGGQRATPTLSSTDFSGAQDYVPTAFGGNGIPQMQANGQVAITPPPDAAQFADLQTSPVPLAAPPIQETPFSFEPTMPKAAAPATKPAMAGPAMVDPMQAGVNQQIAGINKQAAAEGALGKQQADLAAQQAQKMADIQAKTDMHINNINTEIGSVVNDIKAGHINPNHYMENLSTGGKIATIFGLILGGATSQYTGGRNLAFEMLQKQIDRDVDAQKANLANKQTLFNAYQHRFGNAKDADAMARITQANIYANKLEQAAAKSRDPIAKAKAMEAIGALKAQYAPLQQQVAHRQAILQSAKEGQLTAGELVTTEFVPEHQKDGAFKELERVESKQQAANDLVKVGQRIAELQKAGQRIGNPLQSKSEIDALNTNILGQAKEIFGKTSDAEIHLLENNLIHYSDSPTVVANKINILTNMIGRETHTPILDAHLGKLGVTNYKFKAPRPNIVTPQGFSPRK